MSSTSKSRAKERKRQREQHKKETHELVRYTAAHFRSQFRQNDDDDPSPIKRAKAVLKEAKQMHEFKSKAMIEVLTKAETQLAAHWAAKLEGRGGNN